MALTTAEETTILSYREEVRAYLASLYAAETLTPVYAEPIPRYAIPRWLEHTHRAYLAMADWMGYHGPEALAWQIYPGYTFTHDAPQEGLIAGADNRLTEWELVNNPPTGRCIAHIIPQIPPGGDWKTVAEQMEFMERIRRRFHLPPHHLTSFGTASLLSSVLLRLRNHFGIFLPAERYFIRTDTSHLFGPLNMGGHGSEGLHWTDWDFLGDSDRCLGFLPVGIDPVIDEDLELPTPHARPRAIVLPPYGINTIR